MEAKYSTKYFCPHCRREYDKTRMLIFNEELKVYQCDIHTNYQKREKGSFIHGNPDKAFRGYVDSFNGVSPDGNGDVYFDFPTADKLTELNQKISESSAINNQQDFLTLVRNHSSVSGMLKTRILSDRTFDVGIPIGGQKYAHYSFIKDTNDDFIKFGKGGISELETIEVINDRQDIDRSTTTGSWSYSAEPNIFAFTPGSTFTFTFNGTGFNFTHYSDNRGGIWEFVLDGDTENSKQISTWREVSSETAGNQEVFRNLADTSHTVVATFKGDDPLNPPSGGAGTSRGWASHSAHFGGDYRPNRYPILIYGNGESLSPKVDMLVESSNKEFAIFVKPADSDVVAEFIPEHSNVGTVFAESQEVYFDDKLITEWTLENVPSDFQSVKIIQEMSAYHTSDKISPIANIYCIHTVNSLGVTYNVKIKWLKDVTSSSGYVNMLPYYINTGNYLLSSLGGKYKSKRLSEAGVDRIDLAPNEEQAHSFILVNETGDESIKKSVCVMKTHNVEKTFRHGELGRKDPLIWLQYRNESMNKLYPSTYYSNSHIIKAGETHDIGATFYIGELPMAYNLLT